MEINSVYDVPTAPAADKVYITPTIEIVTISNSLSFDTPIKTYDGYYGLLNNPAFDFWNAEEEQDYSGKIQ